MPDGGVQGHVGEIAGDGLGDPEVDHLGLGLVVLAPGHQDIARLEIPMHDATLVGMLNGTADLDEELQPLFRIEFVLIAIGQQLLALDVLHGEPGPTSIGGAGFEDLGDARMIHARQGLALGLETSEGIAGIKAGLDDLEGHPSLDGHGLFREVHGTHSADAKAISNGEVGNRISALVFAGDPFG
ncbi:MAG: hypothetical protein MK116_12405 [Phycisphaerales bacterium]|nr:hypothetical protein [Phycisphaerales bacterium]